MIGSVTMVADVLPEPNPLRRPVVLRSAVLLGLIGLWQATGMIADTLWLPPFTRVIGRIGELVATGRIEVSLLSSLATLAVGYVLAVAAGLTLGTAMALSRHVNSALRFYVDAGLFVPPVVFAPVFFAFFGTSPWTLISVVFIFSVFVVIVTTQTAVRGADRNLREMAVSFGGSRSAVLREVTIRGAAPVIFSGLQLGVGRAVKGLIVGEIVVAVVGLGALERQLSGSFDSAGIWGIALIVIVLALVLTGLVEALDRIVNGWARGR